MDSKTNYMEIGNRNEEQEEQLTFSSFGPIQHKFEKVENFTYLGVIKKENSHEEQGFKASCSDDS